MLKKFKNRLRFYTRIIKLAARAGAYLTLFEFLVYRTPLRKLWARTRGHHFHRSTIFWFKEGDGVHTQALFLLPRLQSEYPGLKTVDFTLEFYDEQGNKLAQKIVKDYDPSQFFTLESRRLPAGFNIPAPFSGTLIVKQKINLPDKVVFANQGGLFASTHTYLDYYSEGNFVTTLHDYSAYLPDQGINPVVLGMIPAYCDKSKETFLLFHAVAAGVGPKDIKIILVNANGDKKETYFSGLKPFAMKKVSLSQLFADAGRFLNGEVGQVMVEGFLRQMLRRTAYGVQYPGTSSFSLDHCFYSEFTKWPEISAEERGLTKGPFSPFLVLEDEHTNTSALLYQSVFEGAGKSLDLLIYDGAGKLVVNQPNSIHLSGNSIKKISMREALQKEGVDLPFMGHAELLFHRDGKARSYETMLEHAIEHESGGKVAHVLHMTDLWNSPSGVPAKNYKSGNRIVCNDFQTTYLAISNCSYDYNYNLEVRFRLNLLNAKGQVAASGEFVIGPNATIYEPIEYFFPDAKALLKSSNGLGLAVTTDLNCECLTHAFLTRDRQSHTVSVEHSLSVAG